MPLSKPYKFLFYGMYGSKAAAERKAKKIGGEVKAVRRGGGKTRWLVRRER
jgi:hypothetical protein